MRLTTVALLLLFFAPPASAAETERPRLVVVAVIDQLPRETLDRYAALFSDDGFRRLMERGADFDQCHHGHFPTLTAPGHAVMFTGTYPNRNGVVGNRWYSRSENREVGAVEDKRSAVVGAGAGRSTPTGVSPRRLLAGTVGDALRASTERNAKVVSLSLKDRSAVLLGGLHPNGAYWFDATSCRFVTSAYYVPGLPAWVERFNAAGPCTAYVGRAWERLRPDIDYTQHAGPDDRSWERPLFGFGRTFPHPVRKIDATGESKPYDAVASSPFGNDLLARFARDAIEGEGLGSDAVPDLLAVSFSSNDAVGHLYGPGSQEFLDVTLHTDRLLAAFMHDLDRLVGRGRWVLVLTSDHGASPVPESLEAIGTLPVRSDHYRFDVEAARRKVERRLATRFFGKAGPPAGFGGFLASFAPRTMPFVYLDRKAGDRLPASAPFEDLLAAAAEEIAALEGVARVYRTSQLAAAGDDPFRRAAARGWHLENGGDLLVQLAPYWLVAPSLYAASHGSPYAYDTHVPMLLYGPGIRSGRFHRPVAVVDLAATLAQLFGLSPSPHNEGRPLVEALER